MWNIKCSANNMTVTIQIYRAPNAGDAVILRAMICLVLVQALLAGSRVSCQPLPGPLATPLSQSDRSVIPQCAPDTNECMDQTMAHEALLEAHIQSNSVFTEISIQKLKKGGHNLSVPGPVNFFQGEVTSGESGKFRKIIESFHWRPFWSTFDPLGFAEMRFIDPHEFSRTNYELIYEGNEPMLGRPCWVYQVKPKKHSKGWHFRGTIWVLQHDLTIVRIQGAFHPMRKIHLLTLVEDHWYCFDSWRKEISAREWAPDFTCTGVDVNASDFTNPAFRGRIIFLGTGKEMLDAGSAHSCGMESTKPATGVKGPDLIRH